MEVSLVSLTVNGRPVAVPEGTLLLEAVRAAGVELPTLCYHEGLAPYGACRLCMVAITEPSRALVASCAYPVEEGLVVETDAPEAVTARRLALESLLSRCPQSDVIRELAAREGVTGSRFGAPPPERADELCVLCGLCVRVCREAIGAAAISFVGRGMERRVGTPFDLHADACIGCGACAEICPTEVFSYSDEKGVPEVAKPGECFGCLSCSEICPSACIEHRDTVLSQSFHHDPYALHIGGRLGCDLEGRFNVPQDDASKDKALDDLGIRLLSMAEVFKRTLGGSLPAVGSTLKCNS